MGKHAKPETRSERIARQRQEREEMTRAPQEPYLLTESQLRADVWENAK